MNLLEFPNEILFEFCKHMDFQTRVSFRKTCKQTHSLLNNPKDIVTNEKKEEWFEKMKMIVGMILLDNIGNYIILQSPSGKLGYIRLEIDETCEFFMTINYAAMPFVQKFKVLYELLDDGVIMTNDGLFSKYKLDKHRNIFDYKENISSFLYDLYISFVCVDQNKNKNKISRTQLSNLIKSIIDNPYIFQRIASQIFRCSSYFVFSDKPNVSETFFRWNINEMVNDLRRDLSRYFIDGEEAEQYLRFVV